MGIIEQLKAPFAADKIHFRVGATNKDKTSGLALAYINARDVMERLDDVVGAENWQAEYPFPGCCRIGIRPSYGQEDGVPLVGDWVWKSNGADQTDVEGVKGQYSDAFKRAGVLWGIGRYLYDLDNIWCDLTPQGRSHVIKNPPKLPAWALPSGVVSDADKEMAKAQADGLKGHKPAKKKAAPDDRITDDQLLEIKAMCTLTGSDMGTVVKWIESGDGDYDNAIAVLKKKPVIPSLEKST